MLLIVSLGYDTRCNFNVRSKADISQLNLPHGFESGHSTSLCTYSFNFQACCGLLYEYEGESCVVCFADFSQAFDKVNYWKLFSQMIGLGLSTRIVSLLAYWYSHQQVCVKWHGKTSSTFFAGNGTKQGGLLSPCLFNCYVNLYVRKLISSITT